MRVEGALEFGVWGLVSVEGDPCPLLMRTPAGLADRCSGFGSWGFEVWGLGFGVWGSGLGFRVWGLGFWVWGFGFGVWGLRLRI